MCRTSRRKTLIQEEYDFMMLPQLISLLFPSFEMKIMDQNIEILRNSRSQVSFNIYKASTYWIGIIRYLMFLVSYCLKKYELTLEEINTWNGLRQTLSCYNNYIYCQYGYKLGQVQKLQDCLSLPINIFFNMRNQCVLQIKSYTDGKFIIMDYSKYVLIQIIIHIQKITYMTQFLKFQQEQSEFASYYKQIALSYDIVLYVICENEIKKQVEQEMLKIKKTNPPRPHQPLSPLTKKQLIELTDQGRALKDAAKELGITYHQAKIAFNEYKRKSFSQQSDSSSATDFEYKVAGVAALRKLPIHFTIQCSIGKTVTSVKKLYNVIVLHPQNH
ncbi:hypothetical protein pb186bvf_004114 [Paramecium bursaria]